MHACCSVWPGCKDCFLLCRANCRQTCNLCGSPAPSSTSVPGSLMSPVLPGPTDVNNEAIGRPQTPLQLQGNCTTYTWQSGQWGPCNATCGVGTQSRTVACVQYQLDSGIQAVLPANLCDAAVQPISMTTCILAPCASDYSTACQTAPAASPVSHKRSLLVQIASKFKA